MQQLITTSNNVLIAQIFDMSIYGFNTVGKIQFLIFGILFYLLSKGIFSILRLRESVSISPLLYEDFTEPIYYISATGFMAQPSRKWVAYILFHCIPFLVSALLIVSLLQNRGATGVDIFYCILSGYIVHILINLYQIKRNNTYRYTAQRLIYVFTMLIEIFSGFIIVYLSKYVRYTFLVPKFDDLITGLWTALLTAIVVAVYFQFTNMNGNKADYTNIELEKMINSQSVKLQRLFYAEISDASIISGFPKSTIISILLYENLNRPKFIRFLENMLVLIPGLELTVGIAQVRSNHPLTDSASIYIMANNLVKYKNGFREDLYVDLRSYVLQQYNCDKKYIYNIDLIEQVVIRNIVM